MKIIEGLKLAKELQIKADDLRKKIANHSAHLSVETPVYPDQKGQVSKWLQAHGDITQELAGLHVRIARTNLATVIGIKIGDKVLEKSITEWVYRRRVLAKLDETAWSFLTDRNLKEGAFPSSTAGGEPTKVTIARCYDPVQRDERVTLYKSEPGQIDRSLEVANATIELLD